ncbi:MAG: phosphatidate cytidylyltransferase [Legionellales bacterium]|nr:MAG: phosphatidate cytidylyltransferase [Legionellales bacterium]
MLKKRIITAAILLPLVISALFFLSTEYFYYVSGLVFLAAGFEWFGLSGIKNFKLKILLLLGIPMAIYFMPIINLLNTTILFWCAALGAVVIFPVAKNLWRNKFIALLVGFLLLATAWQALNTLHAMQHGAWLILFVCTLVWAADIGAYFIGKQFGKNKLAPQVSPGKTWQGVLGAVVSSCLVGYIWHNYLPSTISYSTLFLTCLIITLVSIVGDLFESMFKRVHNLKDSGKCLPGHGGLLDRIDSLLAAWPIFIVCLQYLW